jgi:hypothetical protein
LPDPKVLKTIKRIARKRGVPYKHVLAAVETGLVESNLQNLSYGDADSQGWRQERASLYPNPQNLRASVNRFFDEAEQHDRPGLSAGELAARVQRPAEQYRGRYGERKGEAKALLGGYGGGQPSSPGRPSQSDPQVDPRARQALLLNYLNERDRPDALLDLAGGLRSVEATQASYGTPSRDRPPSGAPRKAENLLELFYRGPGGVNVDNGRVVGQDFVSGHEDHVHVATRNPKQVNTLAKLAKRMGLTVTSTTGGKHAEGSFHYTGQALDVAGDPELMRRYAHRVARLYGLK